VINNNDFVPENYAQILEIIHGAVKQMTGLWFFKIVNLRMKVCDIQIMIDVICENLLSFYDISLQC
jgi:hypothetical protein